MCVHPAGALGIEGCSRAPCRSALPRAPLPPWPTALAPSARCAGVACGAHDGGPDGLFQEAGPGGVEQPGERRTCPPARLKAAAPALQRRRPPAASRLAAVPASPAPPLAPPLTPVPLRSTPRLQGGNSFLGAQMAQPADCSGLTQDAIDAEVKVRGAGRAGRGVLGAVAARAAAHQTRAPCLCRCASLHATPHPTRALPRRYRPALYRCRTLWTARTAAPRTWCSRTSRWVCGGRRGLALAAGGWQRGAARELRTSGQPRRAQVTTGCSPPACAAPPRPPSQPPAPPLPSRPVAPPGAARVRRPADGARVDRRRGPAGTAGGGAGGAVPQVGRALRLHPLPHRLSGTPERTAAPPQRSRRGPRRRAAHGCGGPPLSLPPSNNPRCYFMPSTLPPTHSRAACLAWRSQAWQRPCPQRHMYHPSLPALSRLLLLSRMPLLPSAVKKRLVGPGAMGGWCTAWHTKSGQHRRLCQPLSPRSESPLKNHERSYG